LWCAVFGAVGNAPRESSDDGAWTRSYMIQRRLAPAPCSSSVGLSGGSS
jgi:hypothetical protein